VTAVTENLSSENEPNGDGPLFFSEQMHQQHSYNTSY
jgi:hypothetical protein